MSDALSTVLARFPGARATGSGYQARCPAHDDRRASLAISEGDEGRVLLYCHAHCALANILSAAGLQLTDLFPAKNGTGSPKEDLTTYDYKDAAGNLLYQVVRFEPKDFRQRRPDGSGGWIWNMQGVERVLYRLPELAGHARVFVVEGEKDADRLWSVNLPATTGVGGAGKWKGQAYADQLRNAGVQRVVVLPDNDDPGREHGEAVVASVRSAGLVARLVALPGLPPKGDVSDYLNTHTAADLERVVAEAPSAAGPILTLNSLSALLSEPVIPTHWIVEDRIPAGSVCLLGAKPKVGKTTAARCLAAAIAQGSTWLGSSCEQGTVWYIALEGRKADHVAHFRQLGLTTEEAERIWLYVDMAMPNFIDKLRERAEIDHPTIIIVDTLGRLIGVEDIGAYAEVSAAFDPLIKFVRDIDTAILLLHHAGKATDRADSIDTVLGSTAIAGSVDNLMLMSKLPGFRTLTTRQRVGPDLEEMVVQLDRDSGRISLGEGRDYADQRVIATKFYEALQNNNDEPMSQSVLFEAVESRKVVKMKAIRALLADGSIKRAGAGTRGKPYMYHVNKLPDGAPVSIPPPQNDELTFD